MSLDIQVNSNWAEIVYLKTIYIARTAHKYYHTYIIYMLMQQHTKKPKVQATLYSTSTTLLLLPKIPKKFHFGTVLCTLTCTAIHDYLFCRHRRYKVTESGDLHILSLVSKENNITVHVCSALQW